jgi:hypothetical protein
VESSCQGFAMLSTWMVSSTYSRRDCIQRRKPQGRALESGFSGSNEQRMCLSALADQYDGFAVCDGGKYFGDFLRDSPSNLAALNAS